MDALLNFVSHLWRDYEWTLTIAGNDAGLCYTGLPVPFIPFILLEAIYLRRKEDCSTY